MIILIGMSLLGTGCSGKKKKETAETGKAPELKGQHMSGEAKELGKEDSISAIVKKQEEKQAAVMDAPAKEEMKKPSVVEIARDEFRCSKLEGDAREKSRKLNNEGLGYYRKGLYKAAITAFKYAYSLDCNYLLAATNTASTYAKTGKHNYAMGWLNVAYKINPGKTIMKLKKDRDYADFIPQFLLEGENKATELSQAYLAVVHHVPATKSVPKKVEDVQAPATDRKAAGDADKKAAPEQK